MKKQYTFKDLVFKNVGKSKASRRYLARIEFDNNYGISVSPEFMEPNKYELAIIVFNDLTGYYDFLGDLNGDVFRYKSKGEIVELMNKVANFADYGFFEKWENLK